MYTSTLLPLLFLVSNACQSALAQQDAGRIVGGQLTKIDQHPYQVSLRLINRHVCGGAIISGDWVVTAAHCVRGNFRRFLSVQAGVTDLNDRGFVVQVKEVIIHAKYNHGNSDYDIALVRLDRKLALKGRLRSISLAPSNDRYVAGTMATVTGWGVLSSNGSLTTQLRKVDVPLITDAQCARQYASRTITPRMICAGYVNVGGKDACQGDSGGPLVQYGRLIGIVSWGFGCAEPSFPGVYTRVAALRSWITEKTGL